MSEFQKILAMDTALNGCGVGVFSAGKITSRTEPMVSGQAERLIPLIDEALTEAGLKPADLNAIVTTIGPGAFTGLRIGLSTAKSMALALDIPLYGITTLQALAAQYTAQKQPDVPFAVIIETKRSDFYVQTFTANGEKSSEPAALPANAMPDLTGHILIGDGAARYQKETGATGVYKQGYELIDAGELASYFYRNKDMFTREPAPLYLRNADVTTSKQENRVYTGRI